MKNQQVNHGLKITWKSRFDPRRLKRSKRFGAFVDVSQIPDFDLSPNQTIFHQLASSLCTAFSNTTISSIQEGVQLSPEYAYQKTNLLMGVRHSRGADPDKAMKVHTKFGCIEEKDSPFTLDEKGQFFVEDPQNWDSSLDEGAKIHKKQSYMECDGYNDKFDSIRAALWESQKMFIQTRNKRDLKLASTGFYWLPDFQTASQGIIKNDISQPKSNGAGHNVVARGQKTINNEPYIIIQNSYGKNVGDKGLYYFPRAVINKYVIFSRTFEDLDPEEEKRVQWNFIIVLFDKFIKQLNSFVDSFRSFVQNDKKKVETKPPVVQPTIEEKPATEPKQSKLEAFAKAIQEFEGWYEPCAKYPNGSLSYRNNNCGNLKFTSLTQELGAIDKDKHNLCIFESYEKGFNALCNFIKLASENKLKLCKDCTIKSFFQGYAEANQVSYANFVAGKLKVSISEKVADLIS